MPSHFSSRPATSVTLGAGTGDGSGGSISSFGEVLSVSPEPVTQGDFVYGINDKIFLTGTFGNATVAGNNDNFATLTSGTGSNSYSFIRTNRTVRYRPGQGSLVRLTAIFNTGTVGNNQLVGAGNKTDGYYFGYSGSNFGIFHYDNGYRTVQKLSITGNNAGNVTSSIILNGTTASVPLLAGGSSSLANQIGKFDFSNVGTDGGWETMVIGADVYFLSNIDAALTGTYTVANLTGTFSTKVTGAVSPVSFISQSSFNIDTIDGNGPSQFNINPQKGNVYQIGFQYLGFGNAFFQVESPATGRFTPVHMIKNANIRTSVVLKNHNLCPRWFTGNTLTSGTGTSVTLKAASCVGFVEGPIKINISPRFALNSSKTLSSSNTIYPLLTIKTNKVHRETIDCLGQIILQKLSVAAAAASAKFTTCYVYRNAVLANDAVFQFVDSTRSIVSYDTSATSLTGGVLVYSFALSGDNSLADNLSDFDFTLTSGDSFTIALETSGGSATNTPSISLTWCEEQ